MDRAKIFDVFNAEKGRGRPISLEDEPPKDPRPLKKPKKQQAGNPSTITEGEDNDQPPPDHPVPPPKSGGGKSPPLCLNRKTCPGKNHWMDDCPNTSPEERKVLVAEFRKARGKPTKARTKGTVGTVTMTWDTPDEDQGPATVFAATFAR